MTATSASERRTPVLPVAMILAGQSSVHVGAAVATLVFPLAGVAGTVTLRLVPAAVALMLICRPTLRGHSREAWAVVLMFGVVLAAMNTLYYESIDRIPIGPAVTLEVLGPLTLSVITSRRRSSWVWAGLALVGVLLLGEGGYDRLTVPGVLLALAAGALWACYIVLSARTGSRFSGAGGLALAMTVAAVISLPLGVATAGASLLVPRTAGLGASVGVLSSVVPYSLELLALQRIATSVFAVLMSLGPAVAALAGYLVLGQALAPTEMVGIGLVVLASAGAVRTPTTVPAPDGDSVAEELPTAASTSPASA